MAKIVDITEKLCFEENPKIVIKGKELEVNSDATTMLKLMGSITTKSEAESTMEAYELLFGENDRKKIEKMKLPFKDFRTLIECAIELVTGEEGGNDGGEQ